MRKIKDIKFNNINEHDINTKSNQILEAIQNDDINEGVLGSILGGLTGLAAGSAVMKAVCKALGIKEGVLYNLLTSKLVCTSVGFVVGKNL